MATRKKEIEKEVIVTNVGSKGDNVILHLRFTKPQFEDPIKRRLENVIEPLPKSQAEKMGREVARGYMDVVSKQIQAGTQSLSQVLPPLLPPDTIQITLSKQEYVEIGKPTVFDTITLKLTP